MRFKDITDDYLLTICKNFKHPIFATLLFKKRLLKGRTWLPMTEDEARATMGVLHRRLNSMLYTGKHELAYIGCLEINWEGRYHCHMIVDWPLATTHLQKALQLNWRGSVPKKIDLHCAFEEAHIRDDCDVKSVTYVAKGRSKLSGCEAFDPLLIVPGPSPRVIEPPCDWVSAYERGSWERSKQFNQRCLLEVEDLVWKGLREPIGVEQQQSSIAKRNKKTRLPSPKPKRAEFTVEQKRRKKCSLTNA